MAPIIRFKSLTMAQKVESSNPNIERKNWKKILCFDQTHYSNIYLSVFYDVLAHNYFWLVKWLAPRTSSYSYINYWSTLKSPWVALRFPSSFYFHHRNKTPRIRKLISATWHTVELDQENPAHIYRFYESKTRTRIVSSLQES